MNDKFNELTKSMAQSVTRRGALKQFGVRLAGMVLACFGLATKTKRIRSRSPNSRNASRSAFATIQRGQSLYVTTIAEALGEFNLHRKQPRPS